jgi:predicted small lipoprotein YifL
MIFQNQILGFMRFALLRCGLLFAICSVGVLTVGCGQKGPLFLPVVPAVITVPPTEPSLKPANNQILPASAAQ